MEVYSGPHGYTLMASESAVERLNSIVLEDFVAENYTAPHMVLAAAGVEHDELLKIAEPLLSDMPKVHRPAEPKPVYVGGDYRRHADEGTTHFALAFEVPGGWLNQKEVMTLLVIQSLMGGGGSFLAGGPGKGMHSRLYGKQLMVLLQMGTSEDIGKQILHMERKPVEQFLKAIDQVTVKDINSLPLKLITCPFTLASHEMLFISQAMMKSATSSGRHESFLSQSYEFEKFELPCGLNVDNK
ncbi:hypothetical protein ACH5RR_004134 [Cinchona calisaya]|uniref:Peptidase M16 C-terminal domain-containing protein n=1 Tax=Cinchona calisaya TaxID=153742 RepID=A0ABD3AWS0_9GENT